jgi:hypothetical protein
VAYLIAFLNLKSCRFFKDFLIKGRQVKESTAKKLNKAWVHTKKWAKQGQKIAKQGKNKAFAFTANKLSELSGAVTHPGMKSFFRNLAHRLNRNVTIDEGGNTSQVAIESSTRPSRKRNTNQVRSVCGKIFIPFICNVIHFRYAMLAWILQYLPTQQDSKRLPQSLLCLSGNESSF